MLHRARIALALSIAAASFLAACSDSTAPRPPHFAQYLDSLYFATVSDRTLSESVRDSRESIISRRRTERQRYRDAPGLERANTHPSFPLTNLEGERFLH